MILLSVYKRINNPIDIFCLLKYNVYELKFG